MIKLNFNKKLEGADGDIDLNISETVDKKSFLAIFGESGSGKSTILNIIAGVSKPDYGEIIVNDQIWFSSEKMINLPPQKRDIGYLFQDYALFPNMSVEENLFYALGKGDKREVENILKITDLINLRYKKPDNLSGGQKQRVALARAIVRKPKILLLDEPLSALDLEMRQKLQNELILIHQKFGITTILVSHDISEIYKLATNIFQISKGKIVKKGTVSNFFGVSDSNNQMKFSGEIVEILKNSCLVLVGHDILKVSVKNIANIKVGDLIMISTKREFEICGF